MNPRLDRRIRIEQPTPGKDSQGAAVLTWSVFAVAWAEMRDVLPSRSESVQQGLEVARNQVRCRLRYLPGLTSAMRVLWGGSTFSIVGGPAELGRREFTEVVLERFSS